MEIEIGKTYKCNSPENKEITGVVISFLGEDHYEVKSGNISYRISSSDFIEEV